MNEVIIDRMDYLQTAKKYVVDCKIVKGKILQNQVWHLKDKPGIKITFQTPAIIKTNNFNAKGKIIHFTIEQPKFDLSLFQTPTTWICE